MRWRLWVAGSAWSASSEQLGQCSDVPCAGRWAELNTRAVWLLTRGSNGESFRGRRTLWRTEGSPSACSLVVSSEVSLLVTGG